MADEVQVRREDQDKINSFSSLHQRELGLEEQLTAKNVTEPGFRRQSRRPRAIANHPSSALQKEKEELDDITTELELADEDDTVPSVCPPPPLPAPLRARADPARRYKIGGAFFQVSVVQAQEIAGLLVGEGRGGRHGAGGLAEHRPRGDDAAEGRAVRTIRQEHQPGDVGTAAAGRQHVTCCDAIAACELPGGPGNAMTVASCRTLLLPDAAGPGWIPRRPISLSRPGGCPSSLWQLRICVPQTRKSQKAGPRMGRLGLHALACLPPASAGAPLMHMSACHGSLRPNSGRGSSTGSAQGPPPG